MSNNVNWAHEVMEDCIHLHACRRVQAIGKSLRLNCPRYCSIDCNCYQSKNDDTGLITVKKAVDYARRGISSIESGYGAYDVYCTSDLSGETLTLGELLYNMETNSN